MYINEFKKENTRYDGLAPIPDTQEQQELTAKELFHIFSWVAMIGVVGLVTIGLITWLKLPLFESYSFGFFIVMIYGFFEAVKYYSKYKQDTK